MSILTVTGDPFLTTMQTVALGINARAQHESTPISQMLWQQYPAALASYRKQARQGRIQAGDLWVWRDSQPWLALMIVRESATGATRPRYVDRAALRLVRDAQLERITSLALAPLGTELEQAGLLTALVPMLERAAVPVVMYTSYFEGVRAEEVF